MKKMQLPKNLIGLGKDDDIIDIIMYNNSISRSEFKQIVTKRIREVRQEQSLSQVGVADLANICLRYYVDIEAGISMPSPWIFVKICNALGVTMDYIFQDTYIINKIK